MRLTIAREDPRRPEGRALIAESQAALEAVYPPEEIFSFSAEELAGPDTDFLVARDGAGAPVGCVALVACPGYGEVKRLYVRPAARGQGAAAALMEALDGAALARGLALLRLETGPRLTAAVALYRRLGYGIRGPFGAYAPHPASLFMERRLAPAAPRRIAPGDPALAAVLALLRAACAGAEGATDAPVPRAEMDAAAPSAAGELWAIEAAARPVACVGLTPRPGHLALETLAVAEDWRGRGLARALVALAAARARGLGLPALKLRARSEAADTGAALAAMGFRRTGETAPPGGDRPALPTFRRDL